MAAGAETSAAGLWVYVYTACRDKFSSPTAVVWSQLERHNSYTYTFVVNQTNVPNFQLHISRITENVTNVNLKTSLLSGN